MNAVATAARILEILNYAARGKSQYAETVDELGRVKADIAVLSDYEKDLKQDLVATGEQAIDGNLFRATVSMQTKTTTDWKAVCAALMASGRVSMKLFNESVEANTKT